MMRIFSLVFSLLLILSGCENNSIENRNAQKVITAIDEGVNISEINTLLEEQINFDYTDELGFNIFLKALVEIKNVDFLNMLLEKDFDINNQIENGDTALLIALKNEMHFDFIKTLLSMGADPNLCGKNGKSPLLVAVNNDLEIVKLLIDFGPLDFFLKDEYGDTAMKKVLQYNQDLELIKVLTEYGRDEPYLNILVGDEYDRNENALFEAIQHNCSIEILGYMLDRGISPNCQNEDGETPLHFLARTGQYSVSKVDIIERMNFLLDAGARVNILDDNERSVFMQLAKWDSEFDFLKKIYDMNASVFYKDYLGNTAFHYAVEDKLSIPKIDLFLSLGFDVNLKNDKKRNPLMYYLVKHEDVFVREDISSEIKKFISAGMNVNSRDLLGNSLLHFLCKNSNKIELIEYLLENGANINITNNEKETALMISVLNIAGDSFWSTHSKEIGKEILTTPELANNIHIRDIFINPEEISSDLILPIFLLEHGAKPNITTLNGYSPLIMAAGFATDINLVKVLISYGADTDFLTPDKMNLFLTAVENQSNPDVIKYLIDEGYSIPYENEKGDTVLDLLKSNYNLRFNEELQELLSTHL